jgi:AcrR family transcriptional regulator
VRVDGDERSFYLVGVGRGDATRQAILDHAVEVASQVGLQGLTIGRLAQDLQLSKSGLFAHFQSKEELQVQVLEAAASRFVENVVKPGLKATRGEPRVRALFEAWLAWAQSKCLPGGCPFAAAAMELDDRPGSPRERLVRLQKDWLDLLANTVRTAIRERDFRADVDPDQFAHELYGIMLGFHHAARLLKDPAAVQRVHRAFEALLTRARVGRA